MAFDDLAPVGNQEYYTPPRYADAARRLMSHIDLDPASNPVANMASVKAGRIFTKADDGLAQDWEVSGATRVFLNPPYGRLHGRRGPYNVPLWIDKLEAEYNAGHIAQAILLINAFPGTKYFQSLLQRYPVCFTDHRIAFYTNATMKPDPSPMHYNAFFYIGFDDQHHAFDQIFSEFGTVMVRRGYDPITIAPEEIAQ